MVAAIIQARMGSARLPGKVLLPLCGKPALWHIAERAKAIPGVDKVIVATSDRPADDAIATLAQEWGVACCRGSETDVLDRYYQAAMRSGADVVIRLTGDNPLLDPMLLGELTAYYFRCGYAYARTSGYPLGVGGEIFSCAALQEAHQRALDPPAREHVTPYLYREGQTFGQLTSPQDLSAYRLTMDTAADYVLLKAIYEHFYPDERKVTTAQVLAYLEAEPSLFALNAGIKQKKVGE